MSLENTRARDGACYFASFFFRRGVRYSASLSASMAISIVETPGGLCGNTKFEAGLTK